MYNEIKAKELMAGLSSADVHDLSRLVEKYANVSLTTSLNQTCEKVEKQLGDIANKLTAMNKTPKTKKE